MNHTLLAESSCRSLPIRLLTIVGLTMVGQFFLVTCIFFYTHNRLGWQVTANLLLASGQGVSFAAGALTAQSVAARMGRQRMLCGAYVLLALTCLAAILVRDSSLVAIPLLVYMYLSALSWPAFLSLLSSGLSARELSYRLGVYNLTWAAVGLMAAAGMGTLIEYLPIGVFLIPLSMHLICVVLIRQESSPVTTPVMDAPVQDVPDGAGGYSLALRLSRAGLPVIYLAQYGLMAIIPSLPVIKPLSASMQTLVGSAWMGGRLLMFCLLAATAWWHARPRLMVVGLALMGVAFMGVMVRPSVLMGTSIEGDLPAMILWQMVFGACFAFIYCGSLYFGMALSRGSTREGGYHQALCGVGMALGPGLAALTATVWPSSVNAGIATVGVMIGFSFAVTGAITLKHGTQRRIMQRVE